MSQALQLCVTSPWQAAGQGSSPPQAPRWAELYPPQVWALKWQKMFGDRKGRGQMTWGTPTYSHHVLAQEAFDLPSSIVDGECCPILHVAGGFRGVIEAVNLWQRDIGSGLSKRGLGRGARRKVPWAYGPGG